MLVAVILCVQWSALEVHDGILYRKWVPESSKEVPVLQYIVPESLRRQMFELLHSSRTNGHFGLRRTLGSIRRRFYWPGYKQNIAQWCQTCKVCESYKAGHNPRRAPLKQQLVGAPLERIACDIVGPIATSRNGNKYILVVADYFTKFVEAYPLIDQTAQTVADTLVKQWVCRYGVPLVIQGWHK